MIEYRAFRNPDPPALCEIWRTHPPVRALYQPMTSPVFEDTVLAKPFFDREGLIVAIDEQRPIGFVHAGFGPNAAGTDLDYTAGATCMLMVSPRDLRMAIAEQLLKRSEEYLYNRGARLLYGGAIASIAPFYSGLYGGAALPGILESDSQMIDLYRGAGYMERSRRLILQRSLVGFRPVIDRQQIQYRRLYQVEPCEDPLACTWWEACTEGQTERFAYSALPRSGGEVCGTAIFWDVEPLASSWGVHARGLTRLDIAPGPEREGLAIFLIGEALRLEALRGVTLIEAQIPADDESMRLILVEKLGFQVVEQGLELRKELNRPLCTVVR
ncbi:MAG: GNAT family N-acetyltransferase [Pirellulaceae bacterium]